LYSLAFWVNHSQLGDRLPNKIYAVIYVTLDTNKFTNKF
jgi:hypothetical protein